MLTKKRWISLCLTVALLLCCFVALPMEAKADSGTCGDSLKWTLSNGTLSISGTGDMYDYTSSSHAPWYSSRSSVTEIKIGRGVTHIGDYAFRNCAVTSLTIPGNVKSIGQYAFRTNQNMKELVLEEGVETLGTYAFAYCSALTSIKMTSSINLLAERAVFDCRALTDVYYVGTQEQWNAMTIETGNHKLTGAKRTLSTARGTCGDTLYWDLINGVLTISGTGEMYDYSDPHAPWFSYRGSIKEIEIGEAVTSIGDRAFRNCAITEITVPGNVKTIGQYAFRTCDSLKTVTLEEGVQTIEANAFTWCDTLETVNIPVSVTSIEENAFFDCTLLKEVYHPSSLEVWEQVSIGSGNDNLLNANHHFTMGVCGDSLEWEIKDHVLTISGEGPMYDYTDGGAPWYGSRERIQAISVGENVSSIGSYAFQGCSATTVSIYVGIQSIGVSAFEDCGKLAEVSYSGAQLQWNKIDIGNSNAALWAATLKLPASGQCGDDLAWFIEGHNLVISGTGDMYNYTAENKAPWSAYVNTIRDVVFESGITSVGDYAFYELETLSFDFPKTITRIGHKITGRLYGTGHMWFWGTAPEIAEDAFEDAHIIAYVLYWDKSDLKNYGGYISWQNGKIDVPTKQNRLFEMGHVFSQDDVVLYSPLDSEPYIPEQFQIQSYDNTTYGQKTVILLVDGHEVPFTYFITDGTNHLDYIQVSFDRIKYYKTSNPEVVVTAGDLLLKQGTDYTIKRKDDKVVTDNAKLVVTGRGNYDGYCKEFTYAILKKELSPDDYLNIQWAEYIGVPTYPKISFATSQYALILENHINIGKATARLVGQENYYGTVATTYNIAFSSTASMELDGNYLGQAGGTLSENYYYGEYIIAPSFWDFYVKRKTKENPLAAFMLYELDSKGNATLVDSYQNPNKHITAQMDYNFQSVYEDAYKTGGQWYMLSYAWVDETNATYGGVAMLYVLSKVWEAETMIIEALPDDGDFRREYFDAWSDDGNLGLIKWASSNTSIATVDDGVVTLLKPGTVTITGSYGKISASQVLTVEAQPIAETTFLHYYQDTGKANVICDGILLEEGKDYTLSAKEKDGIVDVAITGCRLFEGTIMRQFDTKYGEPVGHTHVFSAVCDPSCETCDFVRESVHTLNPGWKRDAEGHWHVCKLCGEKQDYEAHIISEPDTCAVCGGLNLPGDMNDDYEVTDADAVYLLRHTLFEESYPITRNGDFNGDGAVTDADAIYLLRHTLFGDSYPIA